MKTKPVDASHGAKKNVSNASKQKNRSFFEKIPETPFFSKNSNSVVQSKSLANNTGKPFFSGPAKSKTKTENSQGLPHSLKSGLEQLSGESLSDVKVHQNSQKPTQLNALAFAQEKDIYLAPGQEKHLPHEGWHVIQQMQGRVHSTGQLNGLKVNTDKQLEQEADVMGAKAIQRKPVDLPTTGLKGQSGGLGLTENLTQILSPVQSKDSIAQFTLSTDLQGLLGVHGPVHFEGVVTAIRAASVAERQVAVANRTVLDLIHTRLSPAYGSAVVSELLVGSQNWANPPATDFYTHFVLNSGNGPVPTTNTMNCWESILYAAYLSGQLTAAWIRNYYISAGAVPGTSTNPTPRLWAQLGFTTTLPTYNPATGNIPTLGQLIFYVSGTSSIPGHVAVYVGNNEVISLWTMPNSIRSIQRIPITSISGTIYYGNTPW